MDSIFDEKAKLDVCFCKKWTCFVISGIMSRYGGHRCGGLAAIRNLPSSSQSEPFVRKGSLQQEAGQSFNYDSANNVEIGTHFIAELADNVAITLASSFRQVVSACPIAHNR